MVFRRLWAAPAKGRERWEIKPMADDPEDSGDGPGGGDEAPDLDQLARRYLDLWEDQLRRLASDPEVARAMARTVELMNAGATAFAGMVEAGMKASADAGAAGGPGEFGDERSSAGAERGDAAAAGAAESGAGTAAAGAAPRGADVGVDDLARRVADLERRLAELEDGSGKPGGKSGGGSRSGSRRRRS